MKHDPCYDQPTNMANAGTTNPTGKPDVVSPSKFKRSEAPAATEDHNVKELRDKQLGSNGMQSNGFDPQIQSYETVAPRRGFDKK
jgi:hypothetical protein